VITSFNIETGFVTGLTCHVCLVEVFSVDSDGSLVFEYASAADSEGIFKITAETAFLGPRLTLTATDPDGNTSELSDP
jgi:hypothetical protein